MTEQRRRVGQASAPNGKAKSAAAEEITLEKAFRIERALGVAQRLLVHVLLAVHEQRLTAQRDRQLPGQRLRRSLDRVIRLFEVDVDRVGLQMAVRRETGRKTGLGVEDDPRKSEFGEVLPRLDRKSVV